MHHPTVITILALLTPAIPAVAALSELDPTIGLNCVILPDEKVEISSAVPGIIEDILVRRSQRVSRGDVLARLESSVEEATLALTVVRAETDAEIRLRHVEYGYDSQHRNRLRELRSREMVSAQKLEDSERTADTARLRVQLAEDRRREALHERRRAEAVLALRTITSPIDGIVLQRHKSAGEYVEDQPILRIARLDPLRVEVIAPLALFGTVHSGMQMAIRTEADPERERVASVRAVDAAADPGSATFGIELELANPKHALPAGIKCKARLLTQLAETPLDSGPVPFSLPSAPLALELAEALNAAPETSSDEAITVAVELDYELNDTSPSSLPVVEAVDPKRFADKSQGECLSYVQIRSEGRARSLAEFGKQIGAAATVTESSSSPVIGYLVVTPPERSIGENLVTVKRLRNAGVTDFAVLTRGAYADRISLGVYNGPLSAGRRRNQLDALGFSAEVKPRTSDGPTWRVTLELPASVESGSVRAAVARSVDGSLPEPGSCDSILADAR